MTDLDKLDQQFAKATPGPWTTTKQTGFIGGYWSVGTASDGYLERATLDVSDHLNAANDAEWIAAIHNAAPALIAELREARAVIASVRAMTELDGKPRVGTVPSSALRAALDGEQ